MIIDLYLGKFILESRLQCSPTQKWNYRLVIILCRWPRIQGKLNERIENFCRNQSYSGVSLNILILKQKSSEIFTDLLNGLYLFVSVLYLNNIVCQNKYEIASKNSLSGRGRSEIKQ